MLACQKNGSWESQGHVAEEVSARYPLCSLLAGHEGQRRHGHRHHLPAFFAITCRSVTEFRPMERERK